MCCSKEERVVRDFRCGRHVFKGVETFRYLEVLINRNNEKLDIKERIQKGYRELYCNKMIKDKKLSRNTKIRMYNTLVRLMEWKQ